MVRKIKYESLTEQVYKAVLDMIIDGQIKPHERIVEENIAGKFNISRTTLKRAVNKLIGEGIIEEIPNKGCFLKSYTKKEILDIYDVREMLEGISARTSASMIRPGDLKRLKEIIKRSEKCLQDGDMDSYDAMNVRFHEELTRISQNNWIINIINKFNVINFSLKIGRTIASKKSIKEHRQIIEALEQGRPDMAEELVRKHIRDARSELEQKLKDI